MIIYYHNNALRHFFSELSHTHPYRAGRAMDLGFKIQTLIQKPYALEDDVLADPEDLLARHPQPVPLRVVLVHAAVHRAQGLGGARAHDLGPRS